MQQRIVIADDDLTIISLVSLRLGLARFDVLSAETGADALKLIDKSEPSAVILDVKMPGGGLETLDRIKANPVTQNLPVMMLSGERDTATVMSAMGAGAADYMVKPFNPDRLLDRVNRLVASSAMVWPRMAAAPAAPVWEL
jgi:two-component system cell cycle response regulator